MTKRLNDILFYGLILASLVSIAGLAGYMFSQGGQCLKNPYLYGASKMGAISCYCLQKPNSNCPARFSFNDTFFNITPTICNIKSKYADLNFGNLTKLFNSSNKN